VLDDNVGLTMDKAVPGYFKFIVGFGKYTLRLGIQPVAEQLPIIVKDTGMFTNVSDVLYPVSASDSSTEPPSTTQCCSIWPLLQVPVGEQHSDKESKELGIKMVDVMFEIAAGGRHMFTNEEVGWSDDDYDDLVGQMEHEFRTAPGLLIQYMMLHATKIWTYMCSTKSSTTV
jgi:hypothetical protein